MNKPDKAGEPSIEEILASIRQKSSEGPEASRSAGDGPPDTPAEKPFGASAPPPPREPPPALLDRLNGMARGAAAAGTGATAGSGAQAPASNGAKRPLPPFDQDLADMFDEPDSGAALPAAPKPEMRATPDLGAFAPPSSSAAGGGAGASSASAEPPSLGSQPSKAPPAPFGAPEGPTVAPRPPAYGFPPLTKRGGFYPRSEPKLPPVPGAGDPPAASSSPSSPPASSGEGGAAPSRGAGARFSDLGSLVPGDAVGRGVRTPRSSFGAPPLAGAGTDSLSADPLSPNAPPNVTSASGVGRVLPDLDAGAPAPSFPSAAKPDFATPSLKMPAAEPDLTPSSATTAPKTQEASAPTGASAAPFSTSPSFGRLAELAPVPPLTPERGSLPGAAPEVAATQALDALALGLAASSAKPDASAHDTLPQAVLKPVHDTGAGSEARVPAAEADVPLSAPSSRSLEDVVADMLRPMLQKWVQENMPRIMEKALRSEMQRTLGAGGKPPGSSS